MTMYAEERQQAMAELVAERGRLSVNVLAEEYAVTTETVRRDLSALERMGLVRRVHGGAVPADSLAVIESGLVERDPHEHRREGADRPRGPRPAAARRLHRPHRRRDDHPPARQPAPPRPPAHRGHPRGAGGRPPGRQPPDRAAPAAGTRAHDHAGRRRGGDRRRALAELRVDIGLPRHQRPHRRPRPLDPRPRRGRHQAGDGAPAPTGSSCSPTPARSAQEHPAAVRRARRGRRPRHRRRHLPPPTARR